MNNFERMDIDQRFSNPLRERVQDWNGREEGGGGQGVKLEAAFQGLYKNHPTRYAVVHKLVSGLPPLKVRGLKKVFKKACPMLIGFV